MRSVERAVAASGENSRVAAGIGTVPTGRPPSASEARRESQLDTATMDAARAPTLAKRRRATRPRASRTSDACIVTTIGVPCPPAISPPGNHQ